MVLHGILYGKVAALQIVICQTVALTHDNVETTQILNYIKTIGGLPAARQRRRRAVATEPKMSAAAWRDRRTGLIESCRPCHNYQISLQKIFGSLTTRLNRWISVEIWTRMEFDKQIPHLTKHGTVLTLTFTHPKGINETHANTTTNYACEITLNAITFIKEHIFRSSQYFINSPNTFVMSVLI